MKTKSKILAMILCAILLMTSIAGCSDGGGEQPSGNEGNKSGEISSPNDSDASGVTEITIGLSIDPASLSPTVSMNDGRTYSIPCLFETLVNQYKGEEITGVLAKSWKVLEDGLTYEFELYDYITDHNGNQITASDVVFSYETFEESGPSWFKYVESATAVSEYVVQIKLTSATVGTFENVFCQFYIFDEDSYKDSEDQMNTTPVGTGVYKLKSYTSGAGFVLEKNEDYWQTEDPFNYANIDILNFNVVLETSTLAVQLETGEVDFAPAMNGDNVLRFADGGENDADFDVYQTLDFKFYCLLFDMKEGTACGDNALLRQAIATAIDPSALIVGAAGGSGEVIKSYGNSEYYDYVEKWGEEAYDFYNYDVNKAKELLEQSGYDTSEPLKLLISQSTIFENIAALVQAQCSAIGLTVKINEVETAVFNASAKNDPELFDMRIDVFGSPQHYVAAAVQGSFDRARYGELGTTNLYWDDYLQELIVTATDIDTYSLENTEVLCDYMQEVCIAYPMFCTSINFVYNNSVIAGMGKAMYDRGTCQWGMLELAD